MVGNSRGMVTKGFTWSAPLCRPLASFGPTFCSAVEMAVDSIFFIVTLTSVIFDQFFLPAQCTTLTATLLGAFFFGAVFLFATVFLGAVFFFVAGFFLGAAFFLVAGFFLGAAFFGATFFLGAAFFDAAFFVGT